MATFVLVHGANLGGWCWRLVTPALRQAGHDVFVPSLTGCGDRTHLLSPEIGLQTWVDDIANLLFYEDLDNVVLVGHSNGCAVVSGVADRVPDRIAHVVYLDGAILSDGESLWGLIAEDVRAWMERQLAAAGSTWSSPPAPVEAWVEMARAEGWNEVVARWAGQRVTAEPLKPGRDPIRLKGGEAVDKLSRTYVRFTRSRNASGDLMLGRTRTAGYALIDLDAGHLAPLSDPGLVADALLAIAARHQR
jgi:pimeloyl-ACP methyl ester carboxylesterase